MLSRRGVTLFESLVVVAIIAVLIALFLPVLQQVCEAARRWAFVPAKGVVIAVNDSADGVGSRVEGSLGGWFTIAADGSWSFEAPESCIMFKPKYHEEIYSFQTSVKCTFADGEDGTTTRGISVEIVPKSPPILVRPTIGVDGLSPADKARQIDTRNDTFNQR